MKSPKISIGNSPGFTLIEVVTTLAIVVVLFSIGLPISFDMYRGYLLSSERDMALLVLYEARNRALKNMYGTSHGVRFEPEKFVLFRGDTYIANNSSNEIFPANISIQKGGISEVVFSGLSGETHSSATLFLVDGANTKSISINHEGRID